MDVECVLFFIFWISSWATGNLTKKEQIKYQDRMKMGNEKYTSFSEFYMYIYTHTNIKII